MERWNTKALYGMEKIIPGLYHGKGNPVCSVCHAMPEPTPENTPCPVSHVVLRGKKYEKLLQCTLYKFNLPGTGNARNNRM